MNWIEKTVRWLEKRGVIGTGDSAWLNYHFSPPSKAGVAVNQDTAMKLSTVWAAVRLLSGTVASLPLIVYQKQKPRGKHRASDHQAYKLLHDKPNKFTTSFKMRQALVAHQLLWGNGYAEIEWGKNGSPLNLWLLPPWRVTPQVDMEGRGVYYTVNLPEGGKKTLLGKDILHFANLTTDGFTGISCISAGMESIGLGIAADEYAANFFSNGANVGGVAEHPGKLSPEASKRLKDSLKDSYTGLGNAHRIMLLEEGMKFQRAGIPPNDSQLLETRKFQISDIGRFFGISQLHKLGDLERSTFSNIEHQSIEFVTDTLQPLMVNIEQELNSKLFDETPYFAEHLIEGLLRGDTQTRYQAYSVGRQWGWLSANDVRELENQNPLPDDQGDMYMVPMNMIPAQQALMTPEEPDPPEPRCSCGGDHSKTEHRKSKPQIEERSRRNAMNRSRTANGYKTIFRDAAVDFIGRETRNVLKAAKKHFENRDATLFDEWMEDYYNSYPDYIRTKLRPVMTGLATAINELASAEVASTPGEVNDFVEKYITRFIFEHVDSSKGQLQAIIRNALDEARDPYPDIEERVSEWNEKRPGKIADDQTVSLANAVAVFAFAAGGREYLRWATIGGEACPYCEEMDGMRTLISKPFVSADSELESSDGRMRLYTPTMHAPLHRGCVCQVVPD